MRMPDAGLCAQIACIWEATARKPGNVHRYRDFADTVYTDFLLSAAAIAPIMTTACQCRVGVTVLESVRATRRVVGTNTNLGIVLLLAPLAAVPPEEELRSGVELVLAALDVEDARLVYEAIRLASPGGLGSAAEQDVYAEPTQTLRQIMTLAAGRDLIARQYANGFAEVFGDGMPALLAGLERTGSLEGAIVSAHLHLLARHPDTLISRKRGRAEAEEAARRARAVFEARWPTERAGWRALAELDAWLRAEGHQRNPGTTADLVTSCLFVLLRENTITLPPPFPWFAGFDHD
jgi:triphosphoribosyl-dephospho-CoA synthase